MITYLLDTNILLRLPQPAHPQYAIIQKALHALTAQGCLLVTAPQSLYEFWVVATRPATARGGLNLTTAQAILWLNVFERRFSLLSSESLYAEWKRLVESYGTSGLPAHDARLVAAMKVHAVSHLLTLNRSDFARYEAGESITVVDPQSVPNNS